MRSHLAPFCMTIVAMCVLAVAAPRGGRADVLTYPSDELFPKEDAQRMIGSGHKLLAPVYPDLARYLADHLNLADRKGIGIDLGAGPGDLTLELARRTLLHWVNADINPHFFAHFLDEATSRGLEGRVSAIFADAQALPFRDNYAQVIVSRGSFQFWADKTLAFREIYRVLQPGGVAWIGRGFSPDFPVEKAKTIRDAQAKQKNFPRYDVKETENELRADLAAAEIKNFEILTPGQTDAEENAISYGIWVEIHKSPGPKLR
ncbi:MAG: class I SAM-dependent methyltransferase [Candidatus Sumerlaeota bacterium]|nr:class I SAM-dependent methyltransferase [Candidatus Sumerlaeota bacterium]